MKRAKSLMAIAVVATVTFSATVPVFAVNAPGRFATPDPIVLPVAPIATVDVEEEAPAAPAAFADLAFGSRVFFDNQRVPRGHVPVLANAAQNPDFARLNREFFNNAFRTFQNHSVEGVMGMGLSFHASFEVEDFGQFAVITQVMELGNMRNFARANVVVENVFFIDKATNTQSTEAAFEAYMEAKNAPEEVEEPAIEEPEYVEVVTLPAEIEPEAVVEEEVEEVPAEEAAPAAEEAVAPAVVEFVALGLLEDFDFEILFDEDDELVIVSYDGEFVLSFTVGSEYVMVGDGDAAEEVVLPAATAYEDGYIVVPAYLLVNVLGLELPEYPEVELEEELENDEEEVA